jgi:peptide/nickel transport system permease protein
MTAELHPLRARASRSRSPRILSLARRSPLAACGALILGSLLVIALGAPWLMPFDPLTQDIFNANLAPTHEHWLGTDQFGRDVLSRLMLGGRLSLLLGLIAPLIAGFLGAAIGMMSGYFGGVIDRWLVRATDFLMSFDALLLGVLVAAALGPSIRTAIIAISTALLPHFVRMARATTLSVKSEPYVEAAVAMGRKDSAIILVHILPNIASPLLVMMTLWAATAIRLEATLSFIGLGAQPPAPSWGNMIRDSITNLFGSPLPAIVTGLVITVTVLAFNMVGEAVRDIIDPDTGARR